MDEFLRLFLTPWPGLILALALSAYVTVLRWQLRTTKGRLGHAQVLNHGQDELLLQVATSRANWQQRFWEMHTVVEKVIGQREEWQDRFHIEVAEHLRGQALLEQKVASARVGYARAVETLNRLRAEHGLKPIGSANELAQLDLADLGFVERYFKAMKAIVKESEATFPATHARATIVAAIVEDELKLGLPEPVPTKPPADPDPEDPVGGNVLAPSC